MRQSFIAFLIIVNHNVIAQGIGYEWLKYLENSSSIISAATNDNCILITGNFSGTITIGTMNLTAQSNQANSFLAKVNLNGNPIWIIRDTLYQVSGIAVDKANNIYLTGKNAKYISQSQYSYTETSYLFISKYDKLGNKKWISTSNIQTTTNSTGNLATSIAIDSLGFLYITGNYTNSVSFGTFQLTDNNASAIFVTKYDSSGAPIWAKKIFGTNSNDALTYGQGNEIIVDHNNSVYLTGSYRGNFNFGGTIVSNIGITDIFLTKLDNNGSFLKTISIGGNEVDQGDRLIVDKNNNLILMAKFGDTITINGNQYYAVDRYNNALIIKLSKDSILFATQIGYSNGGDIAADICLDKNQNIIFTGAIGTGWPHLYPMIYRIDTLGNINWSYMIAQSSTKDFMYPTSIVSDTSGSIYLTGSFNHLALFGDTTIGTANSLWHSFFEKIDSTKTYPLFQFPNSSDSSAAFIYPTITHGIVNITSLTKNLANVEVKVYNAVGMLSKKFILLSNNAEIDIGELSSGMYLLEISDNTFNETFKVVKH